jgi:hypothetical protein
MVLERGFLSALAQPMAAAGAVMVILATTVSAAEPTQVERVQAAIDAWLAARAPIEKITGIASYISFGAAGPSVEAFSPGRSAATPTQGPWTKTRFTRWEAPRNRSP